MKISELLNEAEQPKKKSGVTPPQPATQSKLPRARSIDDEPHDDEQGDDGSEDSVDAEREFKQDAVGIGDGIYALSAWVYPDAWRGSGYSDMLMHRITTLAHELDADIGDYEGINDQTIADDRALEIVFYNEQTQTMFRLSASGSRGSGSVEFTPSLVDLQQGGMITNAQMPRLRSIEATVSKWCDAVPEEAAVDDAGGRPNTRAWRSAEDAVTKLFSFDAGDVGGDDAASDPDSAEFWSGSDVYQEPSPEGKKAGDEYMAQLLAKKRAEREAKKTSGPGREKR